MARRKTLVSIKRLNKKKKKPLRGHVDIVQVYIGAKGRKYLSGSYAYRKKGDPSIWCSTPRPAIVESPLCRRLR